MSAHLVQCKDREILLKTLPWLHDGRLECHVPGKCYKGMLVDNLQMLEVTWNMFKLKATLTNQKGSSCIYDTT